MVWTIFEVLMNLLHAIFAQRFILSRLHVTQVHKLHDIACVLAMTTYYTLSLYVAIPMPDVIVFSIPMIYALFIADDKWYVSVFWIVVLAILFTSVVSVSWYVATTMLGRSYDTLMNETGLRIVGVLFTNATLAFSLYLASKIKKDYSVQNWPTFLLFLLTLLTLLVVEESMYTLQVSGEFGEYTNRFPFFWAYIGLSFCIILVILLFHMMAQSMERESIFRAEANIVAQSRQYQQELSRMYTDLRTTKHDLKQHVQTLEEMVRMGKNEEARDYLVAYQEGINNENCFLTGSTAVDALLTAKSMTMKEKNISFRYSLYSLDHLPIRAPDFCTILGNLLDNAIEGTLRIPHISAQVAIQLTFSRSQDMFYIYCTNSYNSEMLRKEKGKWLSSKRLQGISTQHAIGIRSIEHIVDGVEGRCYFEAKNEVFLAKIVLPYQNMEGENTYDTNDSECTH